MVPITCSVITNIFKNLNELITLINYTNVKQIVETLMASPIIDQIIQFKIICIALFTIQSLQSNFTENYVSKIDLYCRNSI